MSEVPGGGGGGGGGLSGKESFASVCNMIVFHAHAMLLECAPGAREQAIPENL